MDWHPIQGGVEILLVTSCYRNWDKLQPDGRLGSYNKIEHRTINLLEKLTDSGLSLVAGSQQLSPGTLMKITGYMYFSRNDTKSLDTEQV